MQSSLGLSVAVTLIYTLICFFDMRFIKKESVPFRVQFKNSVFVFLACVAGVQLLKSIGEDSGEVAGGSITAFTGAPGF